jgi:hypothetical protein
VFGENGQIVDLDEVREAVEEADVLVVGFRGFPERLLIDSRRNEAIGTMACVVEPLRGVEERMHWLGRTRPQFGLPQRFTFFVWPHSVGYLEESGLNRTLFSSVGTDGTPQLVEALDELTLLEWRSRRDSVSGGEWRTLWDAQGTRHGR